MHHLARGTRYYLRRSHPSLSLVRCLSEKGPKTNVDDPHAFFRDQMEEIQAGHELLFGFTNEETTAWKQSGSSLDPSQLDLLNKSWMDFWEREESEGVHDLDINTKFSNIEPSTNL